LSKLNLLAELSIFGEVKSFLEIFVLSKDSKFKGVPKYLISKDFEKNKELISSLYTLLKELSDDKSVILSRVKEKFIDADTKKIKSIFQNVSFIGKFFNQEYKNAKLELQKFAKGKLSHKEWLESLNSKDKYHSAKIKLNSFIKHNSHFCKLVDNCNDLDNLSKLKNYCEDISELYQNAKNLDSKTYIKLIQFIFQNDDKWSNSSIEISKLIISLNQFFEIEVLSEKGDLKKFNSVLDNLNGNFDLINDVLIFKEELIALNAEIKDFIEVFLGSNQKSKLTDVFLKTYYLQVLDEVLKKENKIAPKNLVDKFRNEDFNVRDMWRFKIMEGIEEGQPKENFLSSGDNEVSILKREDQKKRNLKPIRDLLEAIPNLVFSLKPCFMMSPLTVSQYINPNKMKFDVVIFDEASQIMPEDAVPCLIRAKQTIIMGDTQQLPPTTFFLSQDDDDVDEEIEDLESFLSEASTKFRSKSLDWHYRSKNENLIAFSNRFFYENRLITFPNPKEDKSGLEFVHVKRGVYDRGKSRKNRVEAGEVVKIYQDIQKKYPNKSVGIIAFSISQENAIREAFQVANLQIEESIDPHIEDLFVKNLETVQGDERDIIIISFGYGKDSTGKLSYHFGPLNREGGYKRLNVAITRSRFKTIVLSSILPEELDEDKLHSEGVKKLKMYMDFAKNKNFDKFIEKAQGLGFDSGFEEAVYQSLTDEGFSVSSQVGCSGYRIDLAIKHPKKPGEYILGVECDGAQYHSSRYARDRDKIRDLILSGLGWNIHRIWSEDWLNNREFEIEKIKNKVNSILKIKKIETIKKEDFSNVSDVEDFQEISLKSKYKKYKVADLPVSNADFQFNSYGEYTGYSEEMISNRIKSVLEIESPIEKELLFKRVINSFKIQKLGKRIENLFESILSSEISGVYTNGETVSLEKLPIYTPKISKEKDRPFILIPKEELAGAILDILNNTFSISRTALCKDVAKGIYDNNRSGNKIQSKIDEAIAYLIKIDKVKENNNKIEIIKGN